MRYGVAGILIFLIFLGLTPSLLHPLLAEDNRLTIIAGSIQKMFLDLHAGFYAPPDENSTDVRVNTRNKRDLGIVKSHVGNFTIEKTGTYYILVTNTASEALGKNVKITVTDSLPGGLTFHSVFAPGWTCNNTSRLTCTYRTSNDGLPAGASLPIIALTVNVLAAGAPGVTNEARVWVPNDTNPSNNVSSDPTLIPSADLAVVKSINTASPSVGEQVVYTIVVTNYGPSDATNARLTDVLPAALAFDGYTASQGTYDSTTGVWSIGSLAKGISARLSLEATVKAGAPDGATITNTTSGLASDQFDPFTGNDSGSISAHVRYATDLQIQKSHSGSFFIGGSGSFSLVVTNTGSAPAAGTVTVTDDLSLAQADGLTPTAASGNGWTCSITGKLVTCTHPNSAPGLLPGASLSPISLTVDVSPDLVPGSKTNTASVSFSGSGINSASDRVSLEYSCDLGVEKSASVSEAPAGAPVTYTVTVTNAGPSGATNVQLTDNLPAGLVYFSHAASAGSFDLASGLWTIDTLAKNGSATLTLNTYINSAVPGDTVIVNTAGSLSSDRNDPNASNNSASAEVTVTQPAQVNLAFFKAQAQMPGFIHLSWGTLSEANTFGFNLYRSQLANGPYTRLNESIIPAAAPGSSQGSTYAYVDKSTVPLITYYYRLEMIDLSLKPSLQGMLSITGPAYVFVPIIVR